MMRAWVVSFVIVGCGPDVTGSAEDATSGQDGVDTGADEDVSATTCPTPIIMVEDGDEVIPQTRLHLVGSQSAASVGTIAKWQWRVTQPIGSSSVFQPTATTPDPTFEVNVAGRYELELEVTDSGGELSCAPARHAVDVVPGEALHIELLWSTPGDPDETDSGPMAGSDLDLHLLHPEGEAWFEVPYDTFWFNDSSGDGDPSMDRDDTDGAGPENINAHDPDDGCHTVGVHYLEDHDLGPSFAFVRVFVRGSLVFESPSVALVEGDMWTVTRVCWPYDAGSPPTLARACRDSLTPCSDDGDCPASTCGPHVVPDYPLSWPR